MISNPQTVVYNMSNPRSESSEDFECIDPPAMEGQDVPIEDCGVRVTAVSCH